MALNIELLETSFALVAPKADELVEHFYDRLLTQHPELRPLFPDEMGEQRKHLAQALAVIVGYLRKPDQLKKYLHELGIRHVGYRVERAHYPIVGQMLLASLADVAGDAWSDELNQAWSDAYSAVQAIIFEGLDEKGID